MKKLLLVVNPYSGQKKAAKLLSEIIAMFNRADYTVHVYITAGPGDATVEVAADVLDVLRLAGIDVAGEVEVVVMPADLIVRDHAEVAGMFLRV